ncbi:hypothetical protein MIND_00033800 [Mycena indigotica]|uniref:Uncharacterized protein n=1 Tax=Mycena indigotica TaxID=2126181 RepID=A0A8H6WE02_9AGAR|nr:uncharacterized protein MIND_00033800 [Mycena indigotica]KAF7315194.1 hypothetical protein MIND_00033800 [Mycena indigotica]
MRSTSHSRIYDKAKYWRVVTPSAHVNQQLLGVHKISMSDRSESPPLALDPGTLSLLNEFITSKTEQEQRFNDFAEANRVDSDNAPTKFPSVDEYRSTFAEDWQLSQFWYGIQPISQNVSPLWSTNYATQTRLLRFSVVPPLSSPSNIINLLMVLVSSRWMADSKLWLRNITFATTWKSRSPYLITSPILSTLRYATLPLLTRHLSSSDIYQQLAHPSQYTNERVVATLKHILRPSAKLVVLTATSVESVLERLYNEPPLGPLRRTKIKVLHGQLRNDFACWASWTGSEELEC